MATIVKGDLYYRLDGKLGEIKRQMRQGEGYGFNPERLDLALQAIVEGRFEAVGGQFSSVIHASDLIPGYTDKGGKRRKLEVVEDVQPSTFKVNDLEFTSFMRSNESDVRGLKAKLGLVDAKYVPDHSAEIPPELKSKYLVFPGTLLRDSYGCLYVVCLYCSDEECWGLCSIPLNSSWGGDGFRLVRNKNK